MKNIVFKTDYFFLAPEQVQVKATSANQSPAINEFPIIADKSILLWTGVSAGDSEQTVVHLKNSTNSPLRVQNQILLLGH
jgi:hypothetical protein